MKHGGRAGVLVFDDVTSEQIELDVRGSGAVRARAAARVAAMASTGGEPGIAAGAGRRGLGWWRGR